MHRRAALARRRRARPLRRARRATPRRPPSATVGDIGALPARPVATDASTTTERPDDDAPTDDDARRDGRRTAPRPTTAGRHRAILTASIRRAGREPGRRQPRHHDRRLGAGVDQQPLREPALHRARAAALGRRGRRRGRPAHRVRPPGAGEAGRTTTGTPPWSCSATTTAATPTPFGRELGLLLDELGPIPVVLLTVTRFRPMQDQVNYVLHADGRRSATTSASSTGRRAPRRADGAQAARRRPAAPQRDRAGWRWRR